MWSAVAYEIGLWSFWIIEAIHDSSILEPPRRRFS